MNRRDFAKILGSAAAAAAVGCRPRKEIVPLVDSPENRAPGVSARYASVFARGFESIPVEVGTIDGRPIKLDGYSKIGEKVEYFSDAAVQYGLFSLYDGARINPDHASDLGTVLDVLTGSIASNRKVLILLDRAMSPFADYLIEKAKDASDNLSFFQTPAFSYQSRYREIEALIGRKAALVPNLDARKTLINNALSYRGEIPERIEGEPVNYVALDPRDDSKELFDFLKSADSDEIGAVVLAGVDPYYFFSREEIRVLEKIDKSKRISLDLYRTETSENCDLFLPEAHFLESWGDSVGADGTYSIRQSIINPLNPESVSFERMIFYLIKALDQEILNGYDVFETLKSFVSESYDEEIDDLLRGKSIKIENPYVYGAISNADANEVLNRSRLEPITGAILFPRPHFYFREGRDTRNPFLNEIPNPLTKISWDSPPQISPGKARELGLQEGDIVRITSGDKYVETAIAVANVSPEKIFVDLAIGGTVPNFFKLFDGDIKEIEVKIATTGRRKTFAKTQKDVFLPPEDQKLSKIEVPRKRRVSIFSEYRYLLHRWAMAIDLNKCIGCGACAAACQRENNIPWVGEKEVAAGRIMHWIQIDVYSGSAGNAYLPRMCMHCDLAPCESVCPVGASTHSPEGLNETTYNRCVGTRFCMANCPYGARKFNYFEYSDNFDEPANLALNPQVSVRSRGVVEKCTMCVHRIEEAKIRAESEGKSKPGDGEVSTACERACPTGAVIFGDLNDPESRVSRFVAGGASVMLKELGTEPSVFYREIDRSDDAG